VVEFGDTEQVFGMPVDPRTNDYVNGHFWRPQPAFRYPPR
jgi:ABC-type phosphate transport system ATPase subunit